MSGSQTGFETKHTVKITTVSKVFFENDLLTQLKKNKTLINVEKIPVHM